MPLREYAASRGWEAVEYVDRASAGDYKRRTAWRQLLADAAQHRFDLVMVWKLDRAFRSTLDTLSALKQLDHWGVGFASLTQRDLDTTTPAGRLMLTILAAVAEMERELISERVKEGMKLAKTRGSRLGRPATVGTAAFEAKWPATRQAILDGQISRRQAAKKLHIGQATLAALLAGEQADPGLIEAH